MDRGSAIGAYPEHRGSAFGPFGLRAFGGGGFGRGLRRVVAGAFGVQPLEDPGAQAFLELEQRPDAGQIDAPIASQVPDPEDPTDVLLGIQADVGGGARRTDQTLVLVDTEGPRMR